MTRTDAIQIIQGAHHVSVATGADMRMHREDPILISELSSWLPLTYVRAGFDARTFQVMSEMIESDPDVPLTFAPQVEFREQVSLPLLEVPLSDRAGSDRAFPCSRKSKALKATCRS